MNKTHPLLAGLLSGTFFCAVHGTGVADDASATAPEFEIMTDQEIRQHRDRMARLSAEAREAYRDAEYERLKTRARGQGYRLPDQAPWLTRSSTDNAGPDTQVAAADTDGPEANPMPSEAYRATMKQRFERYLEQREQRREAIRAEPRPDDSSAAGASTEFSKAAERRDQAAKRRAEVLAEHKTRREQHQAEVDARRQAHEQDMQDKAEHLRARSEQRQAELLELRAQAGRYSGKTASPTQDSASSDRHAGEAEPVSEALARMREANAAEREKLRQETEQRIAQQRAELEAFRDQNEDPPATTPAASEEKAADSEEARRARMAQRRAEAEAELQALRATPPDTQGRAETAETETKPPKRASSETQAPPRTTAPPIGYYRHPFYPAYPAVRYPAYPYYPPPYWLPPR